MDTAVPLLGTPNIGFFALLIIGGLAGWIAGMLVGSRHWLFTNILIGICGSFIGSRLAELAKISVVGTVGEFVAALVGSVVILIAWRAFHPRRAY